MHGSDLVMTEPKEGYGKSGIILRSIIFYTLFIISIPPTSILMWIFPGIFPVTAWQIVRLWGKWVNSLITRLCRIDILIEGSPAESTAPTLIIANHTGPWETIGLMPYMKNDLSYVLKKELISWKYNFFALGLRALDPIPISREANRGDFSIMVELSQQQFDLNRYVIIFPGGTRKPIRESIQFEPGGVLLAKKLKCRILPMFVDSEQWARGTYIKDYGLLYPGQIRLRFGEMISEEDVSRKKTRELHEQILEFFREQVERKG